MNRKDKETFRQESIRLSEPLKNSYAEKRTKEHQESQNIKKQKVSKAEHWQELKNQRYQLTAIPNSWFKEADQPTAQEETYILRPYKEAELTLIETTYQVNTNLYLIFNHLQKAYIFEHYDQTTEDPEQSENYTSKEEALKAYRDKNILWRYVNDNQFLNYEHVYLNSTPHQTQEETQTSSLKTQILTQEERN